MRWSHADSCVLRCPTTSAISLETRASVGMTRSRVPGPGGFRSEKSGSFPSAWCRWRLRCRRHPDLLQQSEATRGFCRGLPLSGHPDGMNVSTQRHSVRLRLQRWQQVRTWARLIREAECLWHVDVRELKRLGALELSQLLNEVPSCQRSRVNRWLTRYSVSTRLPFESGGTRSRSCSSPETKDESRRP